MSNINRCYAELPEKDSFLSICAEGGILRDVLPAFQQSDECCVCVYGVSDEELRTRIQEAAQYADELKAVLEQSNCTCFDITIVPIMFFDQKETAQLFINFVNQLAEPEFMDLMFELQCLYNEPWKSAKMFLYENAEEMIEELKIRCYQMGCEGSYAIEGEKLLSQMIRKEERQIFDHWKMISACPERIVMDGIIDTSTWLTLPEKKRVLFVLRDKNGSLSPTYIHDEEYPNNFRRELAEIGSGAKTWNNIARWSCIVQNPEMEYEDVKYFDSGAERGKLLRFVAAINLLKEYGGGRTNRDLLEKLSENPIAVDLIKKQIALYQPAVVVACGLCSSKYSSNMELLARMYGVSSEEYKTVEARGRKYRYFLLENGAGEIPIMEFYHPQVTKTATFGNIRGHLLWKEIFEDFKAVWNALN